MGNTFLTSVKKNNKKDKLFQAFLYIIQSTGPKFAHALTRHKHWCIDAFYFNLIVIILHYNDNLYYSVCNLVILKCSISNTELSLYLNKVSN